MKFQKKFLLHAPSHCSPQSLFSMKEKQKQQAGCRKSVCILVLFLDRANNYMNLALMPKNQIMSVLFFLGLITDICIPLSNVWKSILFYWRLICFYWILGISFANSFGHHLQSELYCNCKIVWTRSWLWKSQQQIQLMSLTYPLLKI